MERGKERKKEREKEREEEREEESGLEREEEREKEREKETEKETKKKERAKEGGAELFPPSFFLYRLIPFFTFFPLLLITPPPFAKRVVTIFQKKRFPTPRFNLNR